MEKDESPMRKYVSPEYKARCIDWALQSVGAQPAAKVIEAAKEFYDYVYGDQK